MQIKEIKIFAGVGKNGQPDLVDEITFTMGDVISIVGPTGSGKTTLIDDIALFADCNTPTRRRVLINEAPAPEDFMNDPSQNPVAFITQHTNFLSDLPVNEFLETHADIRKRPDISSVVRETIEFANQLTGEPLNAENGMTELSGGQTRALLIADAVIISNSPVILLDEIENAGINRTKALELLKKYEKIFVFVTHDPRIALSSDFRIVMENGAVTKVLYPHDEELAVAEEIKKIDDLMLHFRRLIRSGERVTGGII
ncbi:MAG: ATP-binding cassette domain-containing protein [Candidatus Omnitrophica bacterium]|nr:ATP-binding cassette domain-containing protein [Candidatus Omnitrophota bacterium]